MLSLALLNSCGQIQEQPGERAASLFIRPIQVNFKRIQSLPAPRISVGKSEADHITSLQMMSKAGILNLLS